MGANMARRLKDRGHTIAAIHDARPEVARQLAAELGAEPAAALSRVTGLSDVVITVVSDDRAMRAIFATHGDSLLRGSRYRSGL